MKFEKTDVWGFEHALRGMRNPLESWNKSDSFDCDDFDNSIDGSFCRSCPIERNCLYIKNHFVIGKNDIELAQKLIRAGSVHRKFMRQIFVSVDITAPLYWWKEFDTYKVGTVANSTSTMHKLASTPITIDCFEMDDFEALPCNLEQLEAIPYCAEVWSYLLKYLEYLRNTYNETKDIRYWKELIRLLPDSWLQKRTVTFDYENLLAICSKGQRRFHKLTEWSKAFIDWARKLPYAQELIFLDEKEEKKNV